MPTPITDVDLALAAELAQQLRVDSIRSSTSAGSGHPTSSMSAADLLAVLVGRHLRYDWDDPGNAANDHLIFSKGHASPLLYSIYKAVGVVSDEELMTGYRRFGSRLEGHPTPVLPWVDVATGSLGQGLPDAVGVALAGKYLDELPYRVWVLCGDSEMAEGSIWEALDKASYYKLSNLVAIVDVNRLGQRGPTELSGTRTPTAAGRPRSAPGPSSSTGTTSPRSTGPWPRPGDRAATSRRSSWPAPSRAAASPRWRTKDWHGKPPAGHMAERAVVELGGERNLLVRGPAPGRGSPRHGPRRRRAPRSSCPATSGARRWPPARPTATRWPRSASAPTWSPWTARSATRPSPTSSPRPTPSATSRCSSPSSSWSPPRSASRVRGYRPFASTFAAFFTRAYDFIRMAAISQANIRLVGSHAGVEIGADGPSQMALEDLAMLRAVHGSTVLYPCDATSAAALVAGHGRPGRHLLHADHPGRLPGAVRRRGDLPGRRVQGAAPDR